jgi:hypothetical protein
MERILVIQNKRIGDVILTAPVLDAPRSRYPQAALFLVMDGACRGVESLLPGVQPLYFYKKMEPGFLAAGFIPALGFVSGIHWNGLAGFWSRELDGSSACDLFDAMGDLSFADLFLTRLWKSIVKALHTIDYHLNLLEGLGFSTKG